MRTNLFRGELVETDDKEKDQQLGRVLGFAGEEIDKAHLVRQHGFASHAPKGSHGIGIAGTGERGLVAFLGMEHQDYRQKDLPEGHSRIYDSKGNVVRMQGDDGIWHDAGDRPQKATGKTINLDGSEKVTLKVGGITLIVRNGRVDIGGEGGSAVMTQSGPSSVVFAKV